MVMHQLQSSFLPPSRFCNYYKVRFWPRRKFVTILKTCFMPPQGFVIITNAFFSPRLRFVTITKFGFTPRQGFVIRTMACKTARHSPFGTATCRLSAAQSAYNLLICSYLGGGVKVAPPAAAQKPCAASDVACMKYRCVILSLPFFSPEPPRGVAVIMQGKSSGRRV